MVAKDRLSVGRQLFMSFSQCLLEDSKEKELASLGTLQALSTYLARNALGEQVHCS